MKTRFANIALLGALFLTVIALLLHDYLPHKRWVVLPDENAWFALYADGLEGGPSHSEWIDEQPLNWRCRVEPEGEFVYCGLNILLSENNRDGVDVSGYDRVRLKFTALSEPKDLRIFIRHYDPQYSSSEDGNSAQFINFSMRAEDLGEELEIGLNEFTVADWWTAERDLPRELTRPHFTNVIALGLDYREQLTPGNHDVKIEKLEFVGDWVSAEKWYLSIILIWLGSIFLFVVARLVALHQSSLRDKQRLQAMASRQRELRQESEKYRELSARDKLTGTYNRHGFERVLTELLAETPELEASLVMIDIDHFKVVNDSRGHNKGDALIARFAQLIYQHTREQDVLCRWGGEEFILLCPYTDAESAQILAEKVRQIVADTEFDPEHPLSLTASFGVCQIMSGEDFTVALGRADQALYQAKAAGRNCTVMASPVAN